jgi:hypothetical protein
MDKDRNPGPAKDFADKVEGAVGDIAGDAIIVASGQNQISTLATAMSAFKPRRSHDPNRSLLRSNQLGPPI